MLNNYAENNYVSEAQSYKRIDRGKKKKKNLKLISKFQRITLETKKSFIQYSCTLDMIIDRCILCTYFIILDTILDRHVVNLRTVNI